ncbi:hypothetical protein GGTG_05146 [Gaeumannomyces tritici R3-111a-1]|uniref:Uncharacterized protein n=1 Tax=Gaeumannomyces tritici (strain R3-111a-1) TaxID=644352 RepID=J3NV34_GAET3|nr:hypothetical protein GGTG_05146 [Gaeumannomyces tritici R3-111a-1]EJT75209.1 hypothetical protein GGTG_05146 [Gaeumannomyces tritici R3-111a-1]
METSPPSFARSCQIRRYSVIYRFLKPGGWVAVSDILAKKMLPEKLVADIAIYMGYIAGARELERN